jgi:hypothetical protein
VPQVSSPRLTYLKDITMKDSYAKIVANAVKDCELAAELRDEAGQKAGKDIDKADRDFARAEEQAAPRGSDRVQAAPE